ncbi:hypothetical protein DICVIV_10369 [Dictyocaulus viviparus]|uniref:Uncharacterized protein n=1 Tax=Dictyocaulus viviparus TaxID=29172 RepID=A0A0D8XIL5_DICVI|nr:hypothetical protein DICVIV_10369 [Dictyocaulus viviparus]
MSKDNTNLSRVHLGSTIGGVETDSDGAISRAQALLLSFKLRDGTSDEQIVAWADNFEEQSKPLVGTQIAFTLIVSCAGGLFVQVAVSAHFDPLIWPVFFNITGIALLWLFCLHQSWNRYSSAAVHPTEKLAFILSHDGPGITVSAIVIVTTTS